MGPDDGLVLVEHLDAPLGKGPRPARLSPEPDLEGSFTYDVCTNVSAFGTKYVLAYSDTIGTGPKCHCC